MAVGIDFAGGTTYTAEVTTAFMRACSRILLAVMLSVSLGWHWGMIQSVAWASMFAERVRTEPVGVALAMTFDGDHACGICLFVREGRQAQGKAEVPVVQQVKLELGQPLEPMALLFPPPRLEPVFLSFESSGRRLEAPPYPPPRRA